VWAGMLVFEKSQLPGVVDFMNKVMGDENEDGKAAVCMCWFVIPGTSFEVGVVTYVWYNGPEDEARTFYAMLLKMQPKHDTTKMVPFSQSGVTQGESGEQIRKDMRAGSIMAPLDIPFLQNLFADLEHLIQTVPDADKSWMGFELHNPTATMKLSQTETAFPNRGRHGTFLLIPAWTKEENDEFCREWGESVDAWTRTEFRRRQTEPGVDEITKTSSGMYPNYNGAGLSSKEVYGVNYEKILNLKKKYDPFNVFKQYEDIF